MVISGAKMQAQSVTAPVHSLADLVCRGYIDDPFKQMIVGVDEGMTYAEGYRRMVVLARYLQRVCDVGPGSMVVLAAPNTASFPAIAAAVQLSGARLALMSPTVERGEFEGIYATLRPDVAIVSAKEHGVLACELFPEVRVLTTGCSVPGAGLVEAVWAGRAAEAETPGEFSGSEPEVVLLTSGSTGKPKAILLRSSSFCRHAAVLNEALRVQPGEAFFVPVPFAHVYGLVGMYTALLMGATLVTAAKYRPETALSLVASTRASIYLGVSTMYLRELRANQEGEWDVSCLRTGLVAGASCPEAVFEEYERRYGCRLVGSYGMTETTATLTVGALDDSLESRANTVGLPIEGAEVRTKPLPGNGAEAVGHGVESLDGAGDGPDAALWPQGELVCKTPSLMEGLFDETGALSLPLDEEGWLHTGDVGFVDAQGRVVVIGRVKDMIIRGGINIYPAEVENAYQDNDEVAECCLVGYPDAELGERSCLCVIMNEDACSSTYELREYAKGVIEKMKIPDVVMKMDDFPRLANGKIDKKALTAHVKSTMSTLFGKPAAR